MFAAPAQTTRSPSRTARLHPLALALLLAATPALLPGWASAQTVAPTAASGSPAAGEVEFSRGVGFAQTPGQTPRTLGKGLPLIEGDRLTTAEGGSAIIKLQDGTRMTVRPNTEMVVQQYRFKENAPDNSMVLQLLRGGFRAITGLISKASPNAARIQTSTATVGIRGTEFDARICAKDCAAEAANIPDKARPSVILASAKLVDTQGQVVATDATGQKRTLIDGSSVYPGDLVETGNTTKAVLAFRDDSRIALGATTRFRVDNFVFDKQAPAEGRFLVSLLRGSVRALTGLIAKANNRNVGFSTATATVGVRGTFIGLTCTGDCESNEGGGKSNAPASDDSGFSAFVLLGAIVVTPDGRTAGELLQAGEGLRLGRNGLQRLSAPPTNDSPDPSQTKVPDSLFSSNDVADDTEGLFLLLRKGQLSVETASGTVPMGDGESVVVGSNGNALRTTINPKFMDFDALPLPNSRAPLLKSVLTENRLRAANVCQ
jgi:hypothetical protein